MRKSEIIARMQAVNVGWMCKRTAARVKIIYG